VTPLEETLSRSWWHLVAHRSEVAEPQAFVRLQWALGDLVVFNDEGDILAFDNQCPHRGTRLFLETAGCAPALCPYHGWSYRGGRVRIPLRETVPVAEADGARLNVYRTAWCGDFLFVGVAPRQDLDTQLGDLAGPLAAISRDVAGRADFNSFDFECDWRVAVENALEGYHVNLVHPDTLAPLALRDHQDSYSGENSVYRAQIGNERTVKALERLARYFDVASAWRGYTSLFVFPFAMVSSTFGYSYALQNFFPSGQPGLTRFSSRLLVAPTTPGAENLTGAFLTSTAALNRKVFEEDHAVCRRVSPHYAADRPDRIFAKSEDRARHFWRTLRDLAET
jgi:phenylpropionate dioxygenase-like ring-hydroxylating dioxygenase large terminal subunit